MRRGTITALAGLLSFGVMWLILRGPWGGAEDLQEPDAPEFEAPALEAAASETRLTALARGAAPAPGGSEPAAALKSPPEEAAGAPPLDLVGPSLVRGTVTFLGTSATSQRPFVFSTDASGRTRTVKVDGSGRFLFTDVAPGKFHVRTYVLGGQPARASVMVEPGDVHTIKLGIEAATLLRIRAGDSSGAKLRDVAARALGEPLSSSVVATIQPPPPILDPPFAGGNNPYGIGSVWGAASLGLERSTATDSRGILVVDQPPPFYASVIVGQAVIETKRVHPGDKEVVFLVDDETLQERQCALTLRVLDGSSGDPLPSGVSVERPYQRRALRKAAADADGWVELANLWPGPATLVISSEGRATIELPIDLRPGETLPLGEVSLGAPVAFSGTVEDPAGRPLSVRVVCELAPGALGAAGAAQPRTARPRATGPRTPREWEVESAADGSFRFTDLPRARFTLRIQGDDEVRFPHHARTRWTSRLLSLDARSGAPNPITLTALPPTEVAIDLTALPSGTHLQILNQAGLPERRLLRTLDRDVWALKLPPGPTTLAITLPGSSAPRTLPFEVTDSPVKLRPNP